MIFLKPLKEKKYTIRINYNTFLKDIKTQDAVLRNLEIIGEAAKNVSESIKKKYPDIPWKEIAGTRDRLIHDYFGVNLDIVWGIIKDDLDLVYKKIKSINN